MWESLSEGWRIALVSIAISIIVAAISIIATVIVTWRAAMKQIPRKQLTVTTGIVENLSNSLNFADQAISVNVNGKKTQNLHRSPIILKNTGNSVVQSAKLNVTVRPNRKILGVSVTGEEDNLYQGWTKRIQSSSAELQFDFVNENEQFKIDVLVDGEIESVDVVCRQEGIRFIRQGYEVKDKLQPLLEVMLSAGMGAGLAVTTSLPFFQRIAEVLTRLFK